VTDSDVDAGAGAPAGWEALAGRVGACTRCPELVASRTQVVVGETGRPGGLALVGEAPGAREDAAGRPFVGKAGQLLDAVLADAGLDRDTVAVLNVLKCRPPRNRVPRSAEVDNCRVWLVHQLRLLAPGLVVTLGLTAATWFLGRGIRLASIRGHVHPVTPSLPADDASASSTPPPVTLSLLPTYHPSAAIRFGPNGAPMAALRADLAEAARLLGVRA
jgi:DNA polymerase